jgi:streptomycin 6-kinase
VSGRRGDDEPDEAVRAELAAVAHEVASEWGLDLAAPFDLARYAFVAPVGEDAVLKVAPEDGEADHEADALELWAATGGLRVLRRDAARRAFVLERARPGDDISRLPEDEATEIAVGLGARLWIPAGAPFRWIGDHVPAWIDQAEREGAELIPLAQRLYAGLAPARTTLVHGDLHHHNILRHGGTHVAIDAKAMLGEPEFDVPSFLWNPLGTRMTLARTERRIAAFVRAGLDERRIRAWTAIRGAYLRAGEAEVIRAVVAGLGSNIPC